MSLVRVFSFLFILTIYASSFAQDNNSLRKLGVTNFHKKSVTVASLPDIRSETVGFEILELDKMSPLFDMGIRENDIILEIDDKKFYSRENFVENVSNMLNLRNKTSILKVNRKGSSFYIILGKNEKKKLAINSR